jgi:hypothetical protein
MSEPGAPVNRPDPVESHDRVTTQEGPAESTGRALPTAWRRETGQAVKELPQPQPPVALGFLKVNPEPIMVVT